MNAVAVMLVDTAAASTMLIIKHLLLLHKHSSRGVRDDLINNTGGCTSPHYWTIHWRIVANIPSR